MMEEQFTTQITEKTQSLREETESLLLNIMTQEQIAQMQSYIEECCEKHCMRYCAQHVGNAVNAQMTEGSDQMSPSSAKLYSRVTHMIHEFGIPAHLRGYQYMREAIMQLYEDAGLMNYIVKTLYPQVAETFTTTASNVERSIRHAIDYAWEYGHLRALLDDAQCGYPRMQHKPSNSELITAAVDKLWVENGKLPVHS